MPKERLTTTEQIQRTADQHGWTLQHTTIDEDIFRLDQEGGHYRHLVVSYSLAGGVKLAVCMQDGEVSEYYSENKRKEAVLSVLRGQSVPTVAV